MDDIEIRQLEGEPIKKEPVAWWDASSHISETKGGQKKNFQKIAAFLFILLLAIVPVATSLFIQKKGTRPVAPSVPESKPKAEEVDPFASITPAVGCGSTIPVYCRIPSPAPVLKGPTPPFHSRVDLSWNCNQTGVDCFTLEKYIYDTTGTCPAGKSCSDPTVAPVAIITISPFSSSLSTCTYTDEIPDDIRSCIAYRLVAKDYNSEKTCTDCLVNNDKDCCLVKSNFVKSCGLPAQVSDLRKEKLENKIKIGWQDNSEIEDGFKIYRREIGVDWFDNILESEIPIATVEKLLGKGLRGEYVDESIDPAKINNYVYSVRPFTDLCGCGSLVTPTPTGTATKTPTPTRTGTPGPSATLTKTPTPTRTPSPTTTSTPKPTSTVIPGESYCEYLIASPTSGNRPLAVHFKGKGYDTSIIKGYRFVFGDGEKYEVFGSYTSSHVEEVDHTYDNVGTYYARLEILDNGDHWKTRDECKVVIIVNQGVVSTSTPIPQATNTPRPGETIVPPVPTSTSRPGATSTPVPSPTSPPSLAEVISTSTPVPKGKVTTAPKPTTTKTEKQPTPTEAKLEVAGQEPGIKIPSLMGILGGFLLIAVGLALVF